MPANTPRRIVTGHDSAGRSILLFDGPTPTSRPLRVTPDPNGTIVHYIDMPPGSSAPMHRTRTIDYGIVLEGEVHLELDDGSDTVLRRGDVVVQRGTAHAWANRSQDVARMLFVLVDGAYAENLRSTLGEETLTQVMGDEPLE
jgi:quercetin dioxygenase-like cupin family protein